jgi:hypothetical protein
MENHMNQENKLQASETVIANAIAESMPLSDVQQDQAFNCGKRASNLQIGIMENLTAYARNLGTSPTYAAWELARTQWTAGYISDRPTIEPATADTAFSRFATQLKENFGLEKPKSDNPVAQAKAEQREKKASELLAAYANTSIGELSKQIELAYQTLAKQPSNKDAKKKVSELDKVIKTKQAVTNKEQAALLKQLREDAIAEIKTCVNTETLEQVIELLQSNR